jgi:hypothetical protein
MGWVRFWGENVLAEYQLGAIQPSVTFRYLAPFPLNPCAHGNESFPVSFITVKRRTKLENSIPAFFSNRFPFAGWRTNNGNNTLSNELNRDAKPC